MPLKKDILYYKYMATKLKYKLEFLGNLSSFIVDFYPRH